MTEYIHPDDFKNWLDEQSGERGALEFFSSRPQTLYWTFCRAGGHCRFLFKEFPLGSQYKADFVILNSYSGVWEVMFIEMEPVDDNVFTQQGVPSKRLAGAIKQVDDWAEYFDMHKSHVRSELVRWAKSKDILGYSSADVISNMSGDYLADPESYLKESFHIIVGRRDDIGRASHKRKATYTAKHGIEIVSYDRIKDLVDLRYQDPEPWLREKS
jgi:hypothetical protein